MPFRSIRSRILLSFALSLLAFAAALGYGLIQLRSMGERLRVLNAVYVPLAGVGADLQAVLRQMDRDLERVGREGPRPLAGHRSSAAFYSASLADDVGRGREMVEGATAQITDRDERAALAEAVALLDEIEEARQGFDQAATGWLEAEAQDQAAAIAARVELDRRRKQLNLQVGQLTALVEGRISAVSERASEAQVRAVTVSGALTGLAAVLAGVMAGVALVTLRPIGRLTAQVQRLAAGEAAGRVDVRSDDEVGVLAREFNAMAEAVAERDRRLSERAEALDRLSLRLRGVLDAIRAGLVVVDEPPGQPGGRVVSMANPASHLLWNISEGEALPDALAALLPEHASELPRRSEALPIGDRLFNVDVVPFGPRGTLIVGEDATERIEDRKRLARSERLALVGQMLAQITHEVRNPLNAMSLNAELLAEDVVDAEARAMLETITGEIRRLERITARYLDLSRRRTPEVQPCEPLALVREVVRVEEEALRRAGVEATVSGDDPRMVELDAEALRRALRNMVRNAVEAGARHVRLEVAVEGEDLVVRVADDGPGLEPGQADRAFEPFFTTKAQGTGLGLAISRQELEDVGGALRLDSAPGGGCLCTLSMPMGREGARAER